MRPFYLTTPIYYVNSVPHLGTAYTTIAADALARYRRLAGDDVRFLTGLDEHGQKVAQAAAEAGVSPQEWTDAIAPKFLETWRLLDISNDDFIRTTEPRHERGAQRFLQALHDAGHLYKGHYEGWYCVPDETFFAEEQLVEGKCPDCGREVQFIREDNWFFALSAFQERLLAYYDEHPDFVQPDTRRNEVMSFVRGGLKDLSISRTTFSWGIPLPFDPEHVMYVWFDALLNYVTAVGYGSDDPDKKVEFERYWPADYHFVGKDIIRFHCVIWPAMLMAAGLPLPKHVFAHGFLLTKGEKMSKSKGNVLAPADLVERFGVDAYRYYFLRDVVFGTDGSVSVGSIVQRYNGDLANDWGNLCSRLFNMTEKYLDGAVPQRPGVLVTAEDEDIMRIAAELPGRYDEAMARLDYGAALEAAWDLVKRTNRYIEEASPWNLAKSEDTRPRLDAVLYNALEAVRIAALFISPVMPRTSAEVWRRLGIADDVREVRDLAEAARWGGLEPGLRVEKGDPLFPRIQEAEEA
ncbi:MAG TPA: methionine--tRNA ligase [Coriobacteriia bacterium]|jgi:methionyl-tRNA synthetase